jgi:hypothetical protein
MELNFKFILIAQPIAMTIFSSQNFQLRGSSCRNLTWEMVPFRSIRTLNSSLIVLWGMLSYFKTRFDIKLFCATRKWSITLKNLSKMHSVMCHGPLIRSLVPYFKKWSMTLVSSSLTKNCIIFILFHVVFIVSKLLFEKERTSWRN